MLAGRSDRDNDYLSFRVAKPNDWWFHVRGMPGSHVILQVPAGDEPDRATLEAAAAIAAYHSKARAGGVVPVTGTRARYVTKPSGVKTGTVQVRKETVFKVRPAPGATAEPTSSARVQNHRPPRVLCETRTSGARRPR